MVWNYNKQITEQFLFFNKEAENKLQRFWHELETTEQNTGRINYADTTIIYNQKLKIRCHLS
jgi:hypothetical protein